MDIVVGFSGSHQVGIPYFFPSTIISLLYYF